MRNGTEPVETPTGGPGSGLGKPEEVGGPAGGIGGQGEVEWVDQGRKVDALKEMGVQYHQKTDHVEDHSEEVPIPK